ncbi:nucleotidyltransferase family protein [Streptomyces sp. NPDC005408]|uniref:nucleotidyltransferase family protein n=1 Tax=Streptomyces sp. NPDC005408 TaxID=3155341 RepID=UPI0033A52709
MTTTVSDLLAPPSLSGLSLEAQLVLSAARLRLTTAQQARIHRFLVTHGKELDWGRLVDLAARHGVLPLLGRNLIRLRLTQSEEGRPLAPYRWILSYVYEGNRRRNLALADEYAKVVRRLNELGIEYAIRKGPVLCEGVYRDIGARRMGDLDVLLRREDFPAFAACADDLGYEQGQSSQSGEKIVPFDRRTRMFWQVNLSNVGLPYLKLAQRDDVELFILDPCFSLFQARSGIDTDSAEFLGRAVPTTVFGEPARMLDPVDQVIDASVQLHVEATTLYYIEIGKDLTLLKFLDFIELLHPIRGEALNRLSDRVAEYDCPTSVHYALHYAAQLYPDDVPGELLSRFTPQDLRHLDEYGELDGDVQTWQQGFAERLFDPFRARSLSTGSNVPGPRAAI